VLPETHASSTCGGIRGKVKAGDLKGEAKVLVCHVSFQGGYLSTVERAALGGAEEEPEDEQSRYFQTLVNEHASAAAVQPLGAGKSLSYAWSWPEMICARIFLL
jgi:hypothetical protein